MKRFVSILLSAGIMLALACPAMAAEQQSEVMQAAGYLQQLGVYQGNASGNLMLDEDLTRAELAALLTRLHGGQDINAAVYDWACYFTDVPAWAKPYVGYCVANLLMNGYGASSFGPSDPVTPAMACTVVLRCCGYPDGGGSVWSYGTACSYAVAQGLISDTTTREASITRGDMAVLIYRTLQRTGTAGAETAAESQITPPANPVGSFTIEAPAWSREDFSRQANPAVFNSVFTRELYNVFRQAIVDAGVSYESGADYAYAMVDKSDYSAVKNLMGRLDGVRWLTSKVPGDLANYYDFLDYFALSAEMPDGHAAVLAFLQPVLDHVKGLGTDAEKAAYLNDYLCTLLEYDRNSVAAMTDVFSAHGRPVQGACSTYARAFNLLCQAAGLPCFTMRTATHAWNLVYADGVWGHVDISVNDQSGIHGILLAEELPRRVDTEPEATRFLKELLVPGST